MMKASQNPEPVNLAQKRSMKTLYSSLKTNNNLHQMLTFKISMTCLHSNQFP